MKKRKRIFLSALLVSVLAVAAWFVFHEREPEYQGKTTTEWLRGVDYTDRSGAARTKIIAAIHAFGTNAIPIFVKMARSSDGRIKAGIIALFNRQKVLRVHFRTEEERQALGCFGLEVFAQTSLPEPPELNGVPPDPLQFSPGVRPRLFMGDTSRPVAPYYVLVALQYDMPTLQEAFVAMTAMAFSNSPPHLSYEGAWLTHTLSPEKAESIGVYKKFPSLKHARQIVSR